MARIIIIDDEQSVLDMITRALEKEEYELHTFVRPQEGVYAIRTVHPDVIITDIRMDTIDGFDVLTKIKEVPELANIPVIILSNLGQKDDIERGIKLGAQDYLIKAHFTPGEVIEKIKKALG